MQGHLQRSTARAEPCIQVAGALRYFCTHAGVWGVLWCFTGVLPMLMHIQPQSNNCIPVSTRHIIQFNSEHAVHITCMTTDCYSGTHRL